MDNCGSKGGMISTVPAGEKSLGTSCYLGICFDAVDLTDTR